MTAPEANPWHHNLSRHLSQRQIEVLSVDDFEPPAGSPIIYLPQTDVGLQSANRLLDYCLPTLALVCEEEITDEDSEASVDVALLGTPWITLRFGTRAQNLDATHVATQEALNETARTILQETADRLMSTNEPFAHADVREVQRHLIETVHANNPELDTDIVAALRYHAYQQAKDLHQRLREAHAHDFLVKASTYAQQIIASEPALRGATAGTLRDATTRHMRPIDPGCATRNSVEQIYVELRLLATQPGPTTALFS